MAQAGSAQREPSMEEILASIRRIIEDSDSVSPPEDVTPAEVAAANDLAQGEVDAFRAELDSAVEEASSSETYASAASGHNAVDFQASSAQHAAERAPLRHEALTAPAAEQESLRVEPAPAEPAISNADTTRGAFGDQELASASVKHPESAEGALARPSIISEQAGRQVAAAFGELSEAFAASRRRSFDEMAEEMLRPMLQDWLDNNLPSLVEKLVREEIERIARGTQG